MPTPQIPAEAEIVRRNPKVDVEWIRQAEEELRASGLADALRPQYRLVPALGGSFQGAQQQPTILNQANRR